MTTITIEWRGGAGDGPVCYLLNGQAVGRGDEGFDRILDYIDRHPHDGVTVKTGSSPLGGESLEDSTPFAGRFPELLQALGGRRLGWSLL